jgi:hypothetical protein
MKTTGAILILVWNLIGIQAIHSQSANDCGEFRETILSSGMIRNIDFSLCNKDVIITNSNENVEVSGYVLVGPGKGIRLVPKKGYRIRLIYKVPTDGIPKPGDRTKLKGKTKDESSPDDDYSSQVVEIYPNPTRSNLFIKSQKKIESYKILNLQGVVLQEGELNSNSISVSHLPYGIYRIVFSTATGIIIKKIVKN